MNNIQKFEIRNSNLETNPDDKNPKFKTKSNVGKTFWSFKHLNFGIVSNFDIRASSFLSIVIVFILLTILISSPIKAQSPTLKTSTPSATPSDVQNKLEQIKILKEKIATKVAEIREKDKKAVMGVVNNIESSTITITGTQKDQAISFSEDTLFYFLSKEGKNQTNIKKIKEGDIISVYGYLAEDKNLISAKYIYIQSPIVHINGKIADKDEKNYTITVSTTQGNKIVDIETYTKTFSYVKDKPKKSAGFSKLKLEEIVHIIGIPNTKEASRVSATKILIISSLNQATPTPTKSIKTSPSPTPESAE